jgi:hypothetical protein
MRQNGSGNFSKVLISPINDASSEFCIAEGELDINHPTLGIIVASPPILARERDFKTANPNKHRASYVE